MRSLTLIGLVLLTLSAILFYATTNFNIEEMKLSHFMGVLAGIGIGLIIGGIVGYVSKGSAIKVEKKKKAYAQLQKENSEYEKQQEALAKQQELEVKNNEQTLL